MNRLINASALTVALLFSTSAFAEDPAYIGRHQSTSEVVNAIMQLTKDFRAALIDKNVKQMSTLMFSSNILFASPASAATVKMINDKEDVNFDGVPSGSLVEAMGGSLNLSVARVGLSRRNSTTSKLRRTDTSPG
jgi:hypothetical protein